MSGISTLILSNLILDKEYCRKVIPFIKGEYFENESERKIFDKISEYTATYLVPPTIDAVLIDLADDKSISEYLAKEVDTTIEEIKKPKEKQSLEWMVDKTEEFCKDRAVYNGLAKSIQLMQEKKGVGAILEVFRASDVSFDTSIGHNYFDDAGNRWEFFHKPENKIPFRLDYMNRITAGGIAKKTLTLIYAGTHVGKSAQMCSLAADNLLNGNNVLYISCEMQEEKMAERIDANLMDIEIDDLRKMSKENFIRKISNIKSKTVGQLVIKEFPTSQGHTGLFRRMLDDLKLKKGFVPDIIYVDYLNICASERMKMGANVNSYTYMKIVSEELRGLAVERDVAIYTASQFTRGASTSSDPGMDDVSESFGISMTGDFIYALIAPDDLKERNLVLVKQLKNRYTDLNRLPKFFLKFDRPKMRFSDAENAEDGLYEVKSSSSSSSSYDEGGKKDFSNFKF